MQRRIKMGKGKIKIASGHQGGVPFLAFMELDKPHAIGEKAGEAGEIIEDKEFDRTNAVVIEFPDYKSVDVVLYELLELWKLSKDKEWDKEQT